MQGSDMSEALDRLRFDPEWYLQNNPDVVASGMEPWAHYVQAGRAEGRPPAPVQALVLDRRLWSGGEEAALAGLRDLIARGPAVEQACAGWVLGRWHASRGEWAEARQTVGLFHLHPLARGAVPQPGPFLLAAQAAMQCSSAEEVQVWMDRLLQACGPSPERDLLELGRARMLPGASADEALRRGLNRLYSRQNLSPVLLADGPGDRFDRLRAAPPGPRLSADDTQPLITVIMPLYNAARTVAQAVDSVLAQDWQRLELLIADDGSTDDSLEIVRGRAAQDPRVRVIETGSNTGTYSVRNQGLAAAQGDFITVHDADDWSHPSKLRLQVSALLRQPELQASVSHWVRADHDLAMSRWRIEPDGWVHRNVSSLMIRAGVREQLGYWDRVRFNADTEYYYRLIAAYGADAIAEVLPGVPLAWGRTHASSLTGQEGSHVRTHLHGVRNDYMTAARYWHGQASGTGDLYLPEQPAQRPFRVPDALAPLDPPGPQSDYDRLLASGRFDAGWYLSAYQDVEQSGQPPALHYLASGQAEDRDPGPEFSSSGYRLAQDLPEGRGALMQWCSTEDSKDATPVTPSFAGRLAQRRGQRVLIVAHAAGEKIFGAERSFIDMLRRLRLRRLVPVVVLPGVQPGPYLDVLLGLSAEVVVVPQAWRQGRRGPDLRTVTILQGLIRTHRVRAVHVNTVVLDAPLAAARAEGCESVVYVRELPAQDPPLCRRLETEPDRLRDTLLEEADRFVANSPLVATWLGCPDRTKVAMNRVDRSLFRLKWQPGPVLRVGMMSSNITKKGIGDAVRTAHLLEEACAPVEIVLIGPWTEDLNDLLPVGPNVSAPGYMDKTEEALSELDVVLSLSHFAESFGRTVLEAMAAGRPVVCYDRGMPAWLVRGGRWLSDCGVVVPADDPVAVANTLAALASDPKRLRRMSRIARLRARWLNWV